MSEPASAAEEARVAALVAEKLRQHQDALHALPTPPRSPTPPPEPPNPTMVGKTVRQPPAPVDRRAAMPDGTILDLTSRRAVDEHARKRREVQARSLVGQLEGLRALLEATRTNLPALQAAADQAWADCQTLGKPLVDGFAADLPAGHIARIDALDDRFLRRLAWARACKDFEVAEETERSLLVQIADAKTQLKNL